MLGDLFRWLGDRLERRPDWSRRHAIDANLSLGEILRERLREGVNRPFRARIVNESLVSFETSDRSAIDDGSPIGQVGNRGPGHVEISIDIGAEGEVPVIVRDLFESFACFLVGRVVDENVEVAEMLDRFQNRLIAEFSIRYIAGQEQRLLPFLLDSLLRRLRVGLLCRQVHDGDVGSLAGIQDSHRPANPRIAASNQGNLPLKFARAAVERSFKPWTRRHGRVETGLWLALGGQGRFRFIRTAGHLQFLGDLLDLLILDSEGEWQH